MKPKLVRGIAQVIFWTGNIVVASAVSCAVAGLGVLVWYSPLAMDVLQSCIFALLGVFAVFCALYLYTWARDARRKQ